MLVKQSVHTHWLAAHWAKLVLVLVTPGGRQSVTFWQSAVWRRTRLREWGCLTAKKRRNLQCVCVCVCVETVYGGCVGCVWVEMCKWCVDGCVCEWGERELVSLNYYNKKGIQVTHSATDRPFKHPKSNSHAPCTLCTREGVSLGTRPSEKSGRGSER